VIYTHPAVREVAVFGIPDPKWGEIVKAVVVLMPGKTFTADELIAYCRRSLANFKVPRSIQFSETELPKSASGKILKRVLRDPLWANQQRAVA
jgi:long-chain acyl-CoA synthetase